jgi:hypothetical protein
MSGVSFLDPFNAKAMTYRQVARTFVPSVKFAELAGKSNALLIGPRGSGKTTLMKMLSLEALRAWEGDEAESYRNAIDYTGIYVPSDIAWGEMVKGLSSANLDEADTTLVSTAAFVTNVLQATVMAMQRRLVQPEAAGLECNYRSAICTASQLEDLVMSVADLWRLPIKSLSLRGLSSSLGQRLLDIKRQANLLATGPTPSLGRVSDLMPFLGLPLVDTVTEALKLFDDLIDDPSMWALLLDEFEVAPEHLQREVLSSLRAAPQKLLFKVALAPCGPHTVLDISDTTRPTRGNDYKLVELWYANKDDAEDFCERLFEARIAKGINLPIDSSATDVFGSSGYAIVDESGEGSTRASYGRGEQWGREFSQLADKDPSFNTFLINKHIDPQRLDPSPQSPNGNTVRKIAPIVAFRNAYKGKVEGRKRGRKPFTSAYGGWSAICAMSEGNPRWLIGMINGITSILPLRPKLPISLAVQQGQLVSMSHAFAEILQTGANSPLRGLETQTPMFNTLLKIGEYFHNRLVLDKFVEDPPMSFTVDNEVSEDVENSLRVAMNHGALVCYESPDSLGGYRSLRGKRFRLAYFLAPEFKLPLRKSKPVNLSTILIGRTQDLFATVGEPLGGQLSGQGVLRWE